MKRTLLLTLNGLLFTLFFLASIKTVIIPVVTWTLATSFLEALTYMNRMAWIYLALPVLVALPAVSILRRRWSTASLACSYTLLLLSILIMCTGIVMVFIEPDTVKAVTTASAALGLAAIMWFNGREIKSYKVLMSQS